MIELEEEEKGRGVNLLLQLAGSGSGPGTYERTIQIQTHFINVLIYHTQIFVFLV